ncbi:hypothetical protein F183_A21660 [Bryobacterales bacterium F-183]|nr:hypothetical protein F183_A21660 [Bryobacterales bacterium F-183]
MSNMKKLGLLAIVLAFPALAQFSSGSTGADGAITIPNNAGVVIFDPAASSPYWSAPLDADGDNVFHFTTITIGSNSRLVLRAGKLRNKAVIFLAQGNVTLAANATIDASGEDGVPISSPVQVSRRPAEPGPGGFPGGLGSRTDTTPSTPASDGYGPVTGRSLAPTTGCSGVAGANYPQTTYMNIAMVPLVGGGGGAGGFCSTAGSTGGNGGAGGGALRIVSSTSITAAYNGTVNFDASGGGPSAGNAGGGPGAGGMIHLIAPTVNAGRVHAYNPQVGSTTPLSQGSGVIRINANSASCPVCSPAAIVGALFNPPLPVSIPELRITQVNGTNVNNPPLGQLSSPDVSINTSSSATVNLAAKNIPPGTVVNLKISSDTIRDQSLTCNALAGTLASSTATCTATFPLGANLTIASASW